MSRRATRPDPQSTPTDENAQQNPASGEDSAESALRNQPNDSESSFATQDMRGRALVADPNNDYLAFQERMRGWDERAKTVARGPDEAVNDYMPHVTTARHRPEWRALKGAIDRCHNPNNESYADYGGRGITVHEQWRGFGGFGLFFGHIGPKPSSKATLDRIDNSRGYEPGNVRWATWVQQANNRRSSRKITWRGETHTAAEWARKLGLRRQDVANRLNKGEPPTLVLCPKPTSADLLEAAAEFIEASYRKSSSCRWKPKLIAVCRRAARREIARKPLAKVQPQPANDSEVAS